MLQNLPNGVLGYGGLAKVEVVGVLGFAFVLLPYSCSALHSYTRKGIPFPAPKAGPSGSAFFVKASRWWPRGRLFSPCFRSNRTWEDFVDMMGGGPSLDISHFIPQQRITGVPFGATESHGAASVVDR